MQCHPRFYPMVTRGHASRMAITRSGVIHMSPIPIIAGTMRSARQLISVPGSGTAHRSFGYSSQGGTAQQSDQRTRAGDRAAAAATHVPDLGLVDDPAAIRRVDRCNRIRREVPSGSPLGAMSPAGSLSSAGEAR